MFYLLGFLIIGALGFWKYQATSKKKQKAYLEQIESYEQKRRKVILQRAKQPKKAVRWVYPQLTSDGFVCPLCWKKQPFGRKQCVSYSCSAHFITLEKTLAS